MKIGFFVDVFYPMIDGVIKVVDNYARLLTEKGVEVTVFCPNGTAAHDDSVYPYKVVRCDSLYIDKYDYVIPTPTLDASFVSELKKSELDVVHIHSPFTVGTIGKQYAKKKNVPMVATIHSQYKMDFERNLRLKTSVDIAMRAIMQVFNSCNECYTVNEEIRRLYIDEYKLTAPCFIRPNATAHTPIEDKKSAYKLVNDTFSLSEDDLVFLFVGRINLLKNLDFLIRSLKILKDEGVAFKMLFVGNGQDEEQLKSLAEELGLSNEIIFCGKIESMETLEKIYARAKLFLFPSLYDTNSLVQIEAACQGTPTLFLKGAKTAGTVTENVNGFFSENSEEAYADKIIEILSDEELYERVSENAKTDLYKTWREVADMIYDDYKRLISEKRLAENAVKSDTESNPENDAENIE